VDKLLKLEFPVAGRFYALYREQFNPDLTVADAVVEEWISVGTFRARKKSPPSRNRTSIGRLPKAADADHQKSDLILKATSKARLNPKSCDKLAT
jgi:hypothetical protein